MLWFNVNVNWIILLQLDLKHIHKAHLYPSDNNSTQALLVMLVTNMTSESHHYFPFLRFTEWIFFIVYTRSDQQMKNLWAEVWPDKCNILNPIRCSSHGVSTEFTIFKWISPFWTTSICQVTMWTKLRNPTTHTGVFLHSWNWGTIGSLEKCTFEHTPLKNTLFDMASDKF